MRHQGPQAAGGFTSFSGMAGDRIVHWIGDESRADELEQQYASASRLQMLLLRNAYSVEGITNREHNEAMRLIMGLPDTDQDCLLCGNGRKTIADTNLCREHAKFALEMRM